jgi:uncharacterized DUF497 family protein
VFGDAMALTFEWDEDKAAANLKKRRVSFERSQLGLRRSTGQDLLG